jgi:CspA family cold shock protein
LPECGKVKWFNENRGYGFMFRTLSEGELVEFDLYEGERGLEARDVRKVE